MPISKRVTVQRFDQFQYEQYLIDGACEQFIILCVHQLYFSMEKSDIVIKMKIYQTVRWNLALIGYKKNLRPFPKRLKWILFVKSTFIIAAYMHLFYVANTTKEFMDSIFVTGMGTLITISHISTIFKMETIFVFMNEIEEVINASE